MKIHDYGRMTVGGGFVGAWQWAGREEPIFGTLRDAYDRALGAAAGFEAKRDEVKKSDKLTPKGIADELSNFARREVIPALAAATKVAIPAAKREIDKRRDLLVTEGPDKSDLVGALLRQEMRTYLRSLSTNERLAMLRDPDPVIALAVIEAPAPLSGVTQETHGSLVEKAIEALHPGELAAVTAIEKATETTERATGATKSVVAKALQMSERDIDQWIENGKAEIEVPKLTRHDGVVKVIRKNATGELVATPATPEEIAIGEFAA